MRLAVAPNWPAEKTRLGGDSSWGQRPISPIPVPAALRSHWSHSSPPSGLGCACVLLNASRSALHVCGAAVQGLRPQGVGVAQPGPLEVSLSGCRRATVSPAARVVRRPSIAMRCPPASVLDDVTSAVTLRSARRVSPPRRARIESAPSAMRSRGVHAGVVDDRASPAHRTTSESKT